MGTNENHPKPKQNDEKTPQPSTGPLKNEPTPERAEQEKLRQEQVAEKKSQAV